MTQNDPILLCDFGGTHGRLGVLKDGELYHLNKYSLGQFASHTELIEQYSQSTGEMFKHIAVAAADAHLSSHFQSGFSSNTKLSVDGLLASGYKSALIINDFEASAWGALDYDGETVVLKKGASSARNYNVSAFIGPGTGLGFAGIIRDHKNRHTILRTHGAHMRPCCVTDEHIDLVKQLQSKQSCAVIYEDIVSGRGLAKLYEVYEGRALEHPHIIFDDPDQVNHKKIIRLFHEFLGLYVQNVMVTCHAYEGVILHGGLLDGIDEAGLLDFDTINQMICQPYVAVVAESLRNAPVYYIKDTYLALYGLRNYLKENESV